MVENGWRLNGVLGWRWSCPADLFTAGSGMPWAVYGEGLAAAHPSNVFLNLSGSMSPVTAVSHNELRVVLPAGVGRNHVARIVVGGRPSNSLIVNYGVPTVTGFEYNTVRAFNGTSVLCFSVYGYNFGGEFVMNNRSLMSVTVNAVPCLDITDVTHTSLVCCSRRSSGLVVVSVSGQSSAGVVLTNEVRASATHSTLQTLPWPARPLLIASPLEYLLGMPLGHVCGVFPGMFHHVAVVWPWGFTVRPPGAAFCCVLLSRASGPGFRAADFLHLPDLGAIQCRCSHHSAGQWVLGPGTSQHCAGGDGLGLPRPRRQEHWQQGDRMPYRGPSDGLQVRSVHPALGDKFPTASGKRRVLPPPPPPPPPHSPPPCLPQ